MHGKGAVCVQGAPENTSSTWEKRGEELSGDRVKAAVHLILTSVEGFLQIPNGMNWRHGLAKYPSAVVCLCIKDDQHSTSRCGEEEQDIKTNNAKPFRIYNKLQSELYRKHKRKNGRGKIQRKPLVTNLAQWQWVNRTGRKNCSTPRSLLIPGENEDGNRSEGQVFHLRKTH